MAATDPSTPDPRRFSIRLPRPLWIWLAAVVLVIWAVTDKNLRTSLPEPRVNRQTAGDDFRAGPEEARQDIKSGKLRYMLYGEPQPHDVLFSKILKANYGITLVHFGCRISEELRIAADGYNNVIHEYLKQQSKDGVIKEAEVNARRQWDREHAESKAHHE